jgi:non-canonical purine NTP pyrophosphatase (RdgB/HAM1 family)
MEILIATGNKGKLREYARLLADVPVTLLSPADVGLEGFDVVEDGETFEDNAKIKARAYADASGKITLADDSGLCVDALKGAPGVHSARYGGAGLDDTGRRHKLLADLEHVTDDRRTAHFDCVIALFVPESELSIVSYGQCPGSITRADSDGNEGFGYDAIFMPDGYSKTFAQLPSDVKNDLSHRGKAADDLVPVLQRMVEDAN